jgi:hypothetical protein
LADKATARVISESRPGTVKIALRRKMPVP